MQELSEHQMTQIRRLKIYGLRNANIARILEIDLSEVGMFPRQELRQFWHMVKTAEKLNEIRQGRGIEIKKCPKLGEEALSNIYVGILDILANGPRSSRNIRSCTGLEHTDRYADSIIQDGLAGYSAGGGGRKYFITEKGSNALEKINSLI